MWTGLTRMFPDVIRMRMDLGCMRRAPVRMLPTFVRVWRIRIRMRIHTVRVRMDIVRMQRALVRMQMDLGRVRMNLRRMRIHIGCMRRDPVRMLPSIVRMRMDSVRDPPRIGEHVLDRASGPPGHAPTTRTMFVRPSPCG